MFGKTNIANSSSELYADYNIELSRDNTIAEIDYIYKYYRKEPIKIKLSKPSCEVYVLVKYNIATDTNYIITKFSSDNDIFVPGENGEVVTSISNRNYGCALLHYIRSIPLEKIELSFSDECYINEVNEYQVNVSAQIIYIR